MCGKENHHHLLPHTCKSFSIIMFSAEFPVPFQMLVSPFPFRILSTSQGHSLSPSLLMYKENLSKMQIDCSSAIGFEAHELSLLTQRHT